MQSMRCQRIPLILPACTKHFRRPALKAVLWWHHPGATERGLTPVNALFTRTKQRKKYRVMEVIVTEISATKSTKNSTAEQPVADRPALTAEEYAQAARADSTVKSYANDIRYITGAGCPLPATPADVVEWLTKAARHLAPATIQRRLVSLSVWHQENGHPSPTCDQKVKRVYAGICRTLGTKQRSVKPLVRDDLIAVLVAAITRTRLPRLATRRCCSWLSHRRYADPIWWR